MEHTQPLCGRKPFIPLPPIMFLHLSPSNEFKLNTFRTAELATVIIAAAIPTAPRLWRYFRTGERNTQAAAKNIAYKPSAFPKPMRLPCFQDSTASSTGDTMTSEGLYTQLHDRSESPETEEMQMQILKTHRIDVVSEEMQRAQQRSQEM